VAATEAAVAYRSKTPPARLREILKELVDAGRAALLAPGLYVHTETAHQAEQRLAGLLGDFHKQSPQSPGMELDALVAASGMAKNVLESLLARLKAAGKTAERSGRFALATHRETFADKDRQAMDRVEALFRERLFSPPGTAEAAAGARISDPEAARIVRLLLEHQRLVQVAPDILFHAEAVERARAIVVDFIRKEGQMESVKMKYLLDTTRKFAIPMLDHLDRIGVTRAVGHTRYLRAQWKEG
jgi:selenocysteine-specific elongation factor